ncbi:LysR family transcriptional regulator [Thiotrichales bacterium 19S9-12]|nr:LysR family transcriptional regulator [Thiotrichales bacterium 19S9-11]MCF6811040.1 LysR family transcriptional regulator [Thiotrichales bacterium 19S9-12]
MISLKQLQLFLALTKHENLTLAAEKCFLSQPAASLALKELENRLNVQLFDRVGRKLILNANGKAIQTTAEMVVGGANELQEIFKDKIKAKGILKLGASMTVGNYFLPKQLIEFKKRYANINPNLTIINSQKIVDKLINYEIDFGFVEDEVEHEIITKIPIKKDQLVIICRKNHPLENSQQVTCNNLKKYPWVLREKGSGTRNIFEKQLTKNKIDIDCMLELGSNEAIIESIAHSDALGSISYSLIEPFSSVISVIPQKLFDLDRYFYLLVNQDKYQSEVMKAFLSFMEHQV